jgi:hypothetical protein
LNVNVSNVFGFISGDTSGGSKTHKHTKNFNKNTKTKQNTQTSMQNNMTIKKNFHDKNCFSIST